MSEWLISGLVKIVRQAVVVNFEFCIFVCHECVPEFLNLFHVLVEPFYRLLTYHNDAIVYLVLVANKPVIIEFLTHCVFKCLSH